MVLVFTDWQKKTINLFRVWNMLIDDVVFDPTEWTLCP